MVRIRQCSFCGYDIEPGTGHMYIKMDGTVFYFCSQKCHKNQFKLKRNPRRKKWTKLYQKKLKRTDTKIQRKS
ncbi:MAG: 50S ribosomal protein L24e [Candidatus Helarchaeota archaeon]